MEKRSNEKFDVVTGAFGFTGKYITKLLLEEGGAEGKRVKTLTAHPNRPDPFGGKVETMPFNFDDTHKLVESIRGAHTVYNTYWVRFNHGRVTFGGAVANVQNLIHAAKKAGVKRFVHISITNPDLDSSSPYFEGKALMEKTLIESGLSYALLRPTVLFGTEDILFNNIAWLLRRFPVFVIPGTGEFRLQPVFVEDLAALAVDAAKKTDDMIIDAVGPETFSFTELVRLIKEATGSSSFIVKGIPPDLAWLLTKLIDPIVGDVILTRHEVAELMDERLVSYAPPTCPTRYSEWLKTNGKEMGKRYASELKRHYK